MREIKFRAWNECEKIMEYDIQEEYDGDLSCFGCYLNNEFWEVMQYTGLKDKNGVEIYDGDILRVRHFTPQSKDGVALWCENVEVKYLESLAQFVTLDSSQKDNYIINELSEVIGNIYENPELLEGK